MLSFLLLIPVIGATVLGFLPGKIESGRLRQITTVFAAIAFAWSIWLLTQFDLGNAAWQFSEYLPWAKQIGLSYSLAVDGLSLPLLVLNALLTIIAIYSIGENVERPRLYYSLILLINAGITGALTAQNLLLFIIFYELELIPFYLMIAIWGGEKKGYAAIKFLLYTAVSGLLVLVAFLGIAFLSGTASFDYDTITTQGLSLNTQLVLLTILLIGFSIKIPLVPLHTWLPDAYTEA
ncbi:MAG: proton-conducting transporter membrane subunit, partial [Spirulinaceae cyanobacterium]